MTMLDRLETWVDTRKLKPGDELETKIKKAIEQAVGNREAADEARQKAIQLYLAYRRDGGENHEPGGGLCA